MSWITLTEADGQGLVGPPETRVRGDAILMVQPDGETGSFITFVGGSVMHCKETPDDVVEAAPVSGREDNS